MRYRACWMILLIILSGAANAFTQPELGKWWKNSEIVNKLQLSESQVGKIERSFLDHQQKLAKANTQLKRQEEELKTLMQSDRVDDGKVQAQIERVAASRAALERTNALMMLSIRKALSKKQWIELEEIQTVPLSAASSGVMRGTGDESKAIQIEKGVYKAGGPVTAPQILYQRLPLYTQAARDAKAEGTVLIEAIVRKDGSIDSAVVKKALGYGLDQSAIRTIMKDWKFKPGTLNGQPVDVQILIETSFRLY
jgi:TonB family protein